MFLRALLVIASGFIFIFSPGLPMGLISRYSPDYKRDLVYWGIGLWLVTNLINQFFSSILRQVMYQGAASVGFTGQPLDFSFIFFSALIAALFIGLGMLIVLRIKSKDQPAPALMADGLALGFGAGLVAQVFTGIILVGAGFQVLFGNTASNITVEAISTSNALLLSASIIALILFRVAFLAASAVQGVLTAQSIGHKKGRFWIAVLAMTLFMALVIYIQLILGGAEAGQVSVGITPAPISIATAIYYLAAFIAAYYWLINTLKIKKK